MSYTVYTFRQRHPEDWTVVEESQDMEISRNDILVPCIHANMLPSSQAEQAEDSVDFNLDVSSIAKETTRKMKRLVIFEEKWKGWLLRTVP